MLLTVSVALAAMPKVYSNCYDGYLNVRAEPTSKSKIVGKLPNGPEGAELLGVDGKWSKVRVNGVVGYVFSSYLQSKPTEPVYISASAVVGEWVYFRSSYSFAYTIHDNGKFSLYVYEANSDTGNKISGTWYLSRDKLILKFSDGSKSICSFDEYEHLIIDGSLCYKN